MNKTYKLSTYLGILALAVLFGTSAAYAGSDGEKAPDQNKNTMQSTIKDAWLDGKLEATLLFNEHLDSFDINTRVDKGVAYLSGVVESDIDRDLAGEIALSIDGVNAVENELEVDQNRAAGDGGSDLYEQRQAFRQSVMDATLTAQIKSKLLLNGNTSGLAINVDSNDGEVTLSGTVDSDQERELAVKIAGNVEGVHDVHDRLTVKESAQNS